MSTPVSLEYPNGRVHVTSVDAGEEIRPGYEFELHGRRWRAVKLVRAGRSGIGKHAGRVLCVAVSNAGRPPPTRTRAEVLAGIAEAKRMRAAAAADCAWSRGSEGPLTAESEGLPSWSA